MAVRPLARKRANRTSVRRKRYAAPERWVPLREAVREVNAPLGRNWPCHSSIVGFVRLHERDNAAANDTHLISSLFACHLCHSDSVGMCRQQRPVSIARDPRCRAPSGRRNARSCTRSCCTRCERRGHCRHPRKRARGQHSLQKQREKSQKLPQKNKKPEGFFVRRTISI